MPGTGTILLSDLHDRANEFSDWVSQLNAPPPPAPAPEPPPSPVQPLDTLGQAKDSFLDWANQLHAQAEPAPAVVTELPTATPATRNGTNLTISPEPPSDFLQWINQGAQDVGNAVTQAIQPAPQHDPSPPIQTPGTQIANAPNARGQVFPLASAPSNKPNQTYHLEGGSDLMAPRGTPVLSMQGGTVQSVYTDNGSHTVGGNGVLIHGDDGLDYYYAHFDQPPGLKSGQRVSAGDQIGAVGNSGNAWKGGQGETHLHIGIGHGISNGVGAEGGLGQNFNAQALLSELQGGLGQGTLTEPAPAPAPARDPSLLDRVGQGQRDFISSLQPLAQQVAQATGIDPNAMLAIAANETGWGRSQTAQQQNNLFSIQGDGRNGSRWATYNSPVQAFSAFTDLISTAPRYAQAWAARADPTRFVDELRKAGYVADEPGFPAQGWVDQVKSIYRNLPAAATQTGQDLVRQTQDTLAATQQTGAQTTAADQQMASFPSRSELEDVRMSGFRAPDEILNPGGIVSSAQQWLQDTGRGFTAPANAIGEFIQPTRVREGQQALAQTTPEQQADLLNQMTSGSPLDVLGRSGLGAPGEGEPLSRQRREAFETTDVSKVPVLGGVLGAVVEDPSALLPLGGGAKLAADTPEVAALAARARRPVGEFLRSESGEFDPEAIVNAARRAVETAPDPPPGISPGDWLRAVRYNSMLSGPRTLEINTLSNALEVPWRFARDTGASLARGRPEEIRPEIDGLRMGLSKGASAFRDAWMNGTTDDIATESSQLLAPRAKNALERGAANALDLTSRTLGATDQWAQAISQGMSLGRQAGVQASHEGLHGQAWQTRVAELMASPTTDMLEQARQVSRRMVYQNDLGALGTALKGVQDTPIGNVILPFLKTIANITGRGIDRSPLGLVGTGIDVGRGKYGRTRAELGEALRSTTGPGKGAMPLGERLGDNLMGTGATVAFYQAAMAGNLTGEGPDDREKRGMLRAQGWQPYSIRVGDQFISYSNWGPLAVPLAMAAGAAEAQTFRKAKNFEIQNWLADTAKRTAGIVTEQSYLQGIGTIWQALEDPERYAPQALAQYITSLIPYGAALSTVGQAKDEVQRQPSRFRDVSPGQYLAESVESRLPVLRESLPPLQDQLGRDVPNERTGVLGALNPLRTSPVRRNEVLNELLQYGVDVGEPVDSFKGMPLTPAEQRVVNRASGPYIEKNVRQTMNEPNWSKWSEEDRRTALSNSVAAARRQAAGELVDRLGTKAFEARLAAEQAKKAPAGIAGP